MKPYQTVLFLFTLLCLTSFYEENVLRFALGDKVCLLKKTIIKESAVTLIALHDNENTAVEAYHNWTAELNINLLELHQADDRYLKCSYKKKEYTVDPNQMFTPAGIEKTLNENNGSFPEEVRTAVKVFADSLLRIFIDTSGKKYVIAIHNNTPDNFSVMSYKNSNNATQISVSQKEDIDDFFIVTDSIDFEYFKNMDLNVVLQSKDAEDDGSLSVYCQKHNIPYINIEAEHGHLNKQIEMIKMVYDLVTEKQ